MTAPRKGLTTGQPPQAKSGFAPYDELGREASGPWSPPNGGDPHGYGESIPSTSGDEVLGARHAITVNRPSAGGPTPVVPDAPDIIQSVHARTGALRPRQPSVERSSDGVRPANGPSDFMAGLTDI